MSTGHELRGWSSHSDGWIAQRQEACHAALAGYGVGGTFNAARQASCGCAAQPSEWPGHPLRLIVTWAIVIVFTTVASAQTLEPDVLRRKQEDQQRARTMTRELLDSVLDLQLRQLEENGLEELPVYRDIKLMRGNLQHVVDGEMSQVVELLATAQRQPPAERERSFVDARKRIRTVVVRLSAERQNLLRRLKAAELAEDARRLIRLQTNAQALVKTIPSEAQSRQESLALKAREDQADVKELFFPLLETLDDVRSWGGPMAIACQDGLRVLQAAEVGQHLDRAETELAAARIGTTVEHQAGVLNGLHELLKLLDKAQGALAAENQAALDRLRALAEKQEAARQETRKLEPNEPTPSVLVEQQSAIQRELADLERSLPIHPTAERLLEQAETAAQEATADLFDGRQEKAVIEQGQVLGNLAALEQILSSGAPASASDKTAAELAELVQTLSGVQEKLREAEAKQNAAVEAAAKDSTKAAPIEREAAETISNAAKSPKLTESIAAQLKTAENAARAAQESLAQTNGPANEQSQKLLERAEDTLDRAQAAVEAALKDAQRQAAAVKIGELARAAEALERAAAEERAVADAAIDLPGETPAAAKLANELADRQSDVAEIAKNIAAALGQTAPQVGEQVAAASSPIEQSRQQLAQAAKDPESARATAKEAADTARQAAKQLAQAAKQLRADVAETSKALANRSEEDAAALAAAREGVEGAMNEAIGSLADRMAKLQAAAAKTNAAAREQQRASGRPDAALAMQLVEQIGEALDAQAAADAASIGQSILPVKAIAGQQAVADMAEQARQAAQQRSAAKSNPADPLARSLAQAQQSAKAAAKAMLDGHADAAKTARSETSSALRQALDSALAEAGLAMRSAPSAAPDLAAERAAHAAATSAEQLAVDDAPVAARTLRDAVQSADQAVAALAAQQPQRAAGPQQETENTLATAQQQLDAALQKLATEQAALLAQQAGQAEQLADQAARVDADAAAALDAARDAASKAGEAEELFAALQRALAKSAEKQMERAAATLAAKEQRVRRDQAVAEALTAVAEKQQSAADILERLRELAEAATDPPTAATDTAEAAQAAEDFAEAQRATGEGAVEISGQTEVANAMLRAALQMAAGLPSAQQAQHSAAMQRDENGTSAAKDASKTPAPANDSSTDEDLPGDLTKAGNQTSADDKSMPADVGFVPQSPETTAQLMAGPQLTKAMQAALDAAMKAAQQPDPNAPRTPGEIPADANAQTQAAQSNAPSKSASATPQGAQPGAEQQNAALKDDLAKTPNDKTNPKSQISGTREGDAEQTLRRLEEQPWFAKLPPELRKSIGAGAQQKAPRAYEERLRRYFQSVD